MSRKHRGSNYSQPYCTIYAIVNTVTGRVYIGNTQNLYLRRCAHLSNLRKGKHPNSALQRDWNTYGEAAFDFRILSTCLQGESSDAETKHIQAHAQNTYNIQTRGYARRPKQPLITIDYERLDKEGAYEWS